MVVKVNNDSIPIVKYDIKTMLFSLLKHFDRFNLLG